MIIELILMDSMGESITGGVSVSGAILTEAGDYLITEGGDFLLQE